MVKRIDDAVQGRAAEGPRPRSAQRPGRPAERRGRRSPPRSCRRTRLVVYTDGRTEDAKREVRREPRGLPARHARRLPAQPAARRSRTCRWWCWSTAARRRPPRSSPARCRTTSAPGHGHADLRQGLGADHPAARQQHRDQAHDGALLHAERPLDPGEGHHARHRRRRARCAPRAAHARSRPRQAPVERPGQDRGAEAGGEGEARRKQAAPASDPRNDEADRARRTPTTSSSSRR